MQLINNSFYDTNVHLQTKWRAVRVDTTAYVGKESYGVLQTFRDEIINKRIVNTKIHLFQTILAKPTTYSNNRPVPYRVKKDKTLYAKPNEYGWVHFDDLQSAEGYVKDMKELARVVINEEIKVLQDFYTTLG